MSATQLVILILANIQRSNTIIFSTDGVSFASWSSNQIKEINSSTKSNPSPISPKELELDILKEDPEEMREFLLKYQQSTNSDVEKCFNDFRCVHLGDCCPSKDQYSLDKTYEFYKCFETINTLHLEVGYLLVSKCSTFINYNVETREKCERDINPKYPPVTSNDVGRSYKNEFCAKCNGDLNFTKWHVEIAIKKFDWFDQITHIRNLSDVADLMKKLHANNTINIFKLPSGMPQPWICDKHHDFIDECNVTGQVLSFESWMRVGCHSYTNPVGCYRNIFCERCNWNTLCQTESHPGMSGLPVSFAALMDLTALQKYEDYLELKEKKNSCQHDEFYDYLQERCRRLYCSLGLFLTPNSNCSYIMISAFDILYKIHFSLIPQSGGITEEESGLVRSKVLETTYKNYPVRVFSRDKYQLNNQTNQKSPRVVDKILFSIHFERVSSTFVKMENEIKTLFYEVRHICFMRSFRMVKDFESFKFSENYISSSSPRKALLYTDIRSCLKVRLSSKEFTLNGDNLVISINDRRMNLTMDRIEFNLNGTAMICLSDYLDTSPNLEWPTPDFIEIILSRVFLSISLLCLAVTLTTYAIFSELRTLPGKCNIFLSFTLLIAQSLFLLGAYENETACAVLGSFRHFAWLSTFSWLSVCSFHMYRVFTRLLVWNDQNSNKILVKYALTAYGLPLLAVGGTVIANMALYGVGVTGYGLPNCFLHQKLQLILALVLPLSLMIVFNSILLLTTIYSLLKTAEQCKMVNHKRRIIVYLKLSSLTGITGFFGFISISFPYCWLRYIFIITNASQGIYVFLSYTLNAKILKLYALKFPSLHIPIRHQRTPSVYTSETTTSTVC